MSNEENNKIQVVPNTSEKIASFWSTLRESKVPLIRVEATPASDVPITSSKFGGRPYIPAGCSNPVDKDGNFMMLLAQLNFSETPGLNDYPDTGIVQVFIDASDNLYGLDIDNQTSQIGFRVIYYEDALLENADLNAPYWTYDMQLPDVYLPITTEHRLTFQLDSEYVGATDIRFKRHFGKDFYDFYQEVGEDDNFWNEFSSVANNSGHKIGGYAYFTQEDPRSGPESGYGDYILLLQIDSEAEYICWGDLGIANFFIHPDDLAKRDFSRVLYNWDCS